MHEVFSRQCQPKHQPSPTINEIRYADEIGLITPLKMNEV